MDATFAQVRRDDGRLRAAAGCVALSAVLAGAGVLAFSAAAARSALVPGSRHGYPAWMAGPLAGFGTVIDARGLGLVLVVMLVGWGVALAAARCVGRWTVAGVVIAAQLLCLLAPPLLSADVFGYIAFGRMGMLHGVDPYVAGTASIPADAVQPFLRWHDPHSPYGPLFTLLSYALVPLGIAASLWTYKLLACAASLAVVGLVWRVAERRGVDPRPAAVLVGLNPVVLAFAVGGGHNDLLVGLMVVGGIALLAAGREAVGSASLVVGAALKLSGGIAMPFAVLGAADRRRALAGVVLGGVGVAVVAVAGFGTDAIRSLTTWRTAAGGVATFSVPTTIARHLGVGPPGGTAKVLLAGVALGVIAVELWRTARGSDWVTCAGWATVAVLCTSTWLLPWYLVWLTPLAALGDSRRLQTVTVALVGFVILTRVAFVGL